MEWDWNEFPTHRRIHYEALGWTEEAWDMNNKSLIRFYNEEEMEWNGTNLQRIIDITGFLEAGMSKSGRIKMIIVLKKRQIT